MCVFVALVTEQAERIRRVILSSVACMALLTLSHERHDFRGGKKTVTEYKMCVLITFKHFCSKNFSF